MSIELDRIVHRREPSDGKASARAGAERDRARATGSLETGRGDERPIASRPATGFDFDRDLDARGDADIRVSLSAAALRIDPGRAAETAEPGASARVRPAPTSDPDAGGADGADADPADLEATAGDSFRSADALDTGRAPTSRQRVFDAYREHVPAPRGERIRVVV